MEILHKAVRGLPCAIPLRLRNLLRKGCAIDEDVRHLKSLSIQEREKGALSFWCILTYIDGLQVVSVDQSFEECPTIVDVVLSSSVSCACLLERPPSVRMAQNGNMGPSDLTVNSRSPIVCYVTDAEPSHLMVHRDGVLIRQLKLSSIITNLQFYNLVVEQGTATVLVISSHRALYLYDFYDLQHLHTLPTAPNPFTPPLARTGSVLWFDSFSNSLTGFCLWTNQTVVKRKGLQTSNSGEQDLWFDCGLDIDERMHTTTPAASISSSVSERAAIYTPRPAIGALWSNNTDLLIATDYSTAALYFFRPVIAEGRLDLIARHESLPRNYCGSLGSAVPTLGNSFNRLADRLWSSDAQLLNSVQAVESTKNEEPTTVITTTIGGRILVRQFAKDLLSEIAESIGLDMGSAFLPEYFWPSVLPRAHDRIIVGSLTGYLDEIALPTTSAAVHQPYQVNQIRICRQRHHHELKIIAEPKSS